MEKRQKELLRPLVAELRRTLAGSADGTARGDIDRELERLGIAPSGAITAFDALPNPTTADRRARRIAEAELGAIANLPERAVARAAFVERAAYGWINRLLAIRVLEARGLIDETLRANPDYEGLSEALYLLRSGSPERASGPDGGWWAVVEDACNAQAASLPGLFALGGGPDIAMSWQRPEGPDTAVSWQHTEEPDIAMSWQRTGTAVPEDSRSDPSLRVGTPSRPVAAIRAHSQVPHAMSFQGQASSTLSDAAIALRPSAKALVHCITLLSAVPGSQSTVAAIRPQSEVDLSGMSDLDAAFADPDAIGWAYQFYQNEAKNQVYARLKQGKKVTTRDEIAAATQLFTEPYMVQWLLQNSLGRSYHELYPDTRLPEQWPYYIRPETRETPAVNSLAELTVIDPCMGSGHFLREAFDMFVAMYREQQPDLGALAIADQVLATHLFGIDIDPRAAQLAAFTLYARAWELVCDERKQRRLPRLASYAPSAMNLATTPGRIAPGALARHLARHPEDAALTPFLSGIFEALQSADTLGSLLRPREHLASAIAKLRQSHQMALSFDPEQQALMRTIEDLARDNPDQLENVLLDRVAASFAAEARGADDVGALLFGQAAERGVRLLQLLDRQYAMVVTNPPYMGSGNMDPRLRAYVEKRFSAGKSDLYSTFILRCLGLTAQTGCLAMVTMHGWLTQSTYETLRFDSGSKVSASRATDAFGGIIEETAILTLAHLGPNAFEEISGEVVQCAMFVLRNARPSDDHQFLAIGLSDFDRVGKDRFLRTRHGGSVALRSDSHKFVVRQSMLTVIPGSPIAYSASLAVLGVFRNCPRLGSRFIVRKGLTTLNNDRFFRYSWESPVGALRWDKLAKAGSNVRWAAPITQRVDWAYEGARIKECVSSAYDGGHWSKEIRSPELYYLNGLVYSVMSRGSLSVRSVVNELFDHKAGFIFGPGSSSLLPLLNTRVCSVLIGHIVGGNELNSGSLESLPIPSNLGSLCANFLDPTAIKVALLSSDITCDWFSHVGDQNRQFRLSATLRAIELLNDQAAMSAYGLYLKDDEGIVLAGYLDVPDFLEDEQLESLSSRLKKLSSSVPSTGTGRTLSRIKEQLRYRYEHGVDASPVSANLERDRGSCDETTLLSAEGAPAESLLARLSESLEVHPISVYWLLQEIRAEGARCKPEELRLLEDRLSVLVLRLLGHRWPKQLEAREPVPEWADADGIIPLIAGMGEVPLAERLRARLRAEDGDLGAQQTEALLQELTGLDLATWLRRTFFPRHVRQFKYRPIAWHLASTPNAGAGKRKGGKNQAPAFECLVYYHKSRLGMLARIRTQYLTPLLTAERGRRDSARVSGDETTAAQATARLQDLEAFAEALQQVEERGFACAELDAALQHEPLDRWSGDGLAAPASDDNLLARERAWEVDINDGVRVNVAPIQLAGLLASDILKEVDARKAIADRARWRVDERRWVRDGVLPRCGWLADHIPESPRWTARAPEREAERLKLEKKRAEAMAKLGGTV